MSIHTWWFVTAAPIITECMMTLIIDKDSGDSFLSAIGLACLPHATPRTCPRAVVSVLSSKKELYLLFHFTNILNITASVVLALGIWIEQVHLIWIMQQFCTSDFIANPSCISCINAPGYTWVNQLLNDLDVRTYKFKFSRSLAASQ